MSTSYAPPGETARDLWQERSNFNGAVLSGFAYGIHFTLFLIAVPLVLRQPKGTKIHYPLLAFISVMFVLGTIFVGANTKAEELQFIDNRNYPGGPNAYTMALYASPVRTLGNTACIVANWLADCLLIYRCLIIYNFRYWVIPGPILMLLGSIATGILVLFETRLPNQNLWTTLSVDFALAFFVINLSLNVILTLLIILRLLYHRRNTRKFLGATHGDQYTSIMSMLVESSALYSTFSLFFIVTYVTGSYAQNLILPMLGEVQMISPLLIVIRVALGSGWSKNTAPSIMATSIQFNHTPTSWTAMAGGKNQPNSTGTVILGFDSSSEENIRVDSASK